MESSDQNTPAIRMSPLELENQKNKILALAGELEVAAARFHDEVSKIDKFHKLAPVVSRFFERAGSGYGNELTKSLVEPIDRACWAYFADMSRIKDLATDQAKAALDQELATSSTPYSAETAQLLAGDFVLRYQETAMNTITEAFESLLGSYWRGAGRTTVRPARGKLEAKMRVSGKLARRFGGGFEVPWNGILGTSLADIERACAILDGKPVPRYPNTIHDTINRSPGGTNLFECEYFSVSAYVKGNQLISFKRLDILEKLNRYGSGGDRLPPVKEA